MKERLMKTSSCVLAVLCTLSTTTALSQGGPPPTSATDVTNAEVQAEAKRAQGAALSDRLISLADMGQYNVAVAVVTRAASNSPSGPSATLRLPRCTTSCEAPGRR